jgi:hypothetical protein
MQLIPFTPKPLAERKKVVSAFNNALVAGVSAGGFPVMSIKGKVFHIVRGDERTLVTKHGEEDPAGSIEAVLINANANTSRVYYAKGYEEGSDSKPDCYSNNGTAPEADAQNPQAKTCATCPHSKYGSRISENGTKGWACANSRRLAIAALRDLDDPMLLRVPGASLKALAQYAKELDSHGYMFNEVVTKIGFDYTVAHPALTFKAVAVLPDDAIEKVQEVAESDLVAQIIGIMAIPKLVVDTVEPESVAALPKKEAAPAAKPAKASKAKANADEAVAAKSEPKVADDAVVEDESSLVGHINEILGDINFDD